VAARPLGGSLMSGHTVGMDPSAAGYGQAGRPVSGSIAFDRSGEGEPLLLIHANGMSRMAWRPVLPLLRAQRDVIAIDLPGHGASPPIPAHVLPAPPGFAQGCERAGRRAARPRNRSRRPSQNSRVGDHVPARVVAHQQRRATVGDVPEATHLAPKLRRREQPQPRQVVADVVGIAFAQIGAVDYRSTPRRKADSEPPKAAAGDGRGAMMFRSKPDWRKHFVKHRSGSFSARETTRLPHPAWTRCSTGIQRSE
jgi:hypothetical protein